MATATQLMPSPTQALSSSFSPYTDSPTSPADFSRIYSSNRSSDHLVPPPSPYPATVDPSPVDSNGTNGTEFEDEEQEDVIEHALSDARSPAEDITSPASQGSQSKQPSRLNTHIPLRTRADSDDAPQSVIHAPAHFKQFNRVTTSAASSNETMSDQTAVVVSPQTPEANMLPEDKYNSHYTHPIDTAVPSGSPDGTTPRAQTRQDFEEDRKRRSSRVSPSLADIAETDDGHMYETASDSTFDQEDNSQPPSESQTAPTPMSMSSQTISEALHGINESDKEVAALKNALNECWTLCNSLSKLSQHHRTRIFQFSGTRGDTQEFAWRTCWRLCQTLYESRNEDPETQIRPTLELCRDFCQALFEVRQRGDEASDSVLRVSFELNNHLYNAHDRNLPEAFRERTLEFYLTLCHRLMKQRTSLPEETDALLNACWSLAEMLFTMRQNSRDGKVPDEELLGSAIQACWELCDLFREGWTQVRPERATPRPSQYTFARPASATHSSATLSEISAHSSSMHSSNMNGSFHSDRSRTKDNANPPETPTTIFDDREEEFSPADEANVPNILVLGPEAGQTRTHDRWSSAASSLSTYSDSSQQSVHTSSTATAGREDQSLVRLKGLIVKAAINAGYSRQTPLPEFVRSLPSNSFGSKPWQVTLYENYKKLVLTDPTLKTAHLLPLRRLTAVEIGRSVQLMARSEHFSWMRDLFRFVFGSFPEDTGQRNLIINA
ncbi:hypothetical protein K504DRAFT_498618 [Pleomassaria siparia CBS 279.74]|uniref:DUF7624 domain-containing protein n=1 Tax=Pleomassaria siparia CBS 279.74 TaxID=1314801 RepID=A0A6G1KMQ2_9PLEO|nr:hypothetical protein K504DRAFT_498618 [Pleomassaria siparia CBS 279.74]